MFFSSQGKNSERSFKTSEAQVGKLSKVFCCSSLDKCFITKSFHIEATTASTAKAVSEELLYFFFFTKIRINVVRKKRRQFFFCTTRKEKRTGDFWLPTSIADLFSKVSKTRYFFLIFFGRYYFFLHCFFQLERKSETKKENIN